METTFKIFVSSLCCLALFLTSGCVENTIITETGKFAAEGDVVPAPVAMSEIPIGDGNTFKISNNRDDKNETFSLTMRVLIRKADERQFERRYEQCSGEVIDEVTKILTASTTSERMEPGLTAIKERVKPAINNILGGPWVQRIFVTDVTYEVQ